jgi:hypothetical protein
MKFNNTYKGKYTLKNPQKYLGDTQNVIYRSLWERKLCVYFDTNINVIQWSIEPIGIPYINPIDGKYHKYWIDFWIKVKDKNGNITEKLIEVKPYKFTQPPVKKSKVTKKYVEEVELWVINNSKWKAAKNLCEAKKWDFTAGR